MRVTDSESSFFEQLRRRASSAGDSIALGAPERDPLSYAQLWSRIETIAATFGEYTGDVVAFLLPDGPDLVAAVCGTSLRCLSAPLNPTLPAPELEARLSVLAPAALVVEAGREDAICVAERLGIQVWELRSTPGSAAGVFELSTRAQMLPGPARSGELADPGLLLHTSATTGRPKLVPLSHANLRAQCLQTAGALRLGETDRFLSLMPLFHLQGILGNLAQLYAGGSAICAPGFDAARFPDWLDEFRPTWYTASPTMHSAILTLLGGDRRRLPCQFRFVRSIGAPLAPDLIAAIENALGAPVIEGYGMTEVGAATSNPLPPGRRKPGSAGISTGAEVAIFDDVGGRLGHDVEGEIRIRGAAVTQGYRNDDAANLSSFSNGWLRTGDLGRFDEDGYLFVTGRAKEVVNRGGEKIMPQEIDAALAAHPAVAEAAAFGVPHPTLGEDIAAVVIRRAGTDVAEIELREFVAARLVPFKVPRRIVFVERIPKGATGKPRRAALRDEFGAMWPRASLDGASDLELKLAGVWKRILRAEVGLDDDFFAAGGDSLAATVMLVEVRAAVAASPGLMERVDFFENPTVRTLARIISEIGSTEERQESALLALQPNGFRRPLFLMPDATSEPYYFRSLAKHLGKDQPTLALRYRSISANGGARTVQEVAARCLEVMRPVQPMGPYCIAGHCFGGIVAFETARQLIAAGETVELLALLDATTPGYPKAPAHWRQYARTLRGVFTREPQPGVSVRQAMQHVRYLFARARLIGGARWRRRLATSPLATVLPQVTSEAGANETAGRTYAPQPSPLRVLQFIAAGQALDAKILADPRLEWRRFALNGFEVREVPGDHVSMFAEPNVQELAAQLRAALSSGGASPDQPLLRSAAAV